MDTDTVIIVFVAPVLASLPVAALLCRYRVSHKKRVSYETIIGTALLITLVWLVVFSEGRCFKAAFWSMDATSKLSVGWGLSWTLRILGFIASICSLSALGVVAYYQKKNKKHELPVA